MTKFIEKYYLPTETQSGYHKGHSTNTATSKLRDGTLKAINRSEITVAVMADFSKAFDTEDYKILINKLQCLNFSKQELQLMVSYL